MEDAFFPIALGNIAQIRNHAAARLRLRKFEMDRLFFRRNLDALDSLQLLDATLHLFRLGGLVAEAIDERFELFNPILLVFESGLQLRPALVTLGLKF